MPASATELPSGAEEPVGSLRVGLDVRSVRATREGIGNYALELARGMAASGEDASVSLVLFGDPRTAWSLLPRVERAVGPVGWRWHAWAARKAERLVEVYHSTGSYFVPLLTKVPVVLTVHDLAAIRCPQTASLWTALTQKALLAASARAQAVIAVSDFVKRDLITQESSYGPKVVAVPHAARSLAPPPTVGIPPGGLWARQLSRGFILAVGSLEPRKNLTALLAAHAALPSPPPLVLVSHRRWKAHAIEAMIRLHPREVRILTDISDCELGKLYASCGVFVFPSLYEGYGLPVIEAMANGAPVVASNVTAIPEVAGDAAVLVDPQDARALARAIERVISDQSWRSELIRRGRERAGRRTWLDVARETAQVYRSVAPQAPRQFPS